MRRADAEEPGAEAPRAGRVDRALLHAALELAETERRAFVERIVGPGEDSERALALLASADHLDGFLEDPLTESSEVFRPPLPEFIGRYRVEGVLGWGSMGVVYLARQAEPARRVALKVLRADTGDPDVAERFRREAQVLAGLADPGIATVYEAGLTDLGTGTQPWFAMEYVDGLPLGEHAGRARLDLRGRVALVVAAARAMHHAHSKGVVHRDLKPDNVLVRADGSVCLVDFGVARSRQDEHALHALTATGQIVGTLAYMAPEQARGSAPDARADQYSLGAILYELLTGELPIPVRGQLPHRALRSLADGTWTPPSRHEPDLAGDLEAVLATALAPEPARRYPNMGAFADDLERWLAGRAVVARSPSRLENAARFVRRNKALVASAAVFFAVLGGVLALALSATLERRRQSALALLYVDQALLATLEAQAESLWPADSSRVADLDLWLARMRTVVGRTEQHRRFLTGIESAVHASVAALESRLDEDWVVSGGGSLLAGLERAAAPGGLLEQMELRRAGAVTLRSRTVDTCATDWAAAAARVREDPRFAGLLLAPQEGLVPLGPDPASGLEEFAVVSTGRTPARAHPSGSIVPRIGDALTLVLIPGGTRWIGGQTSHPGGPNFVDLDLFFSPHEGPAVRVRLDPFLISKFELTQDQWLRMDGVNPSDWEAGTEFGGPVVSLLHPVESLPWTQAVAVLPRHGLDLPTEAQWEVAARGDSPWPRVAGPSVSDLAGHVNGQTHESRPARDVERFPEDRYRTHAPVGSLAPNPFGLHDTLGNVWELCRDVYKVAYHALEHRDGDGLVLATPDGDVARRGQCAATPPAEFCVYVRQVKLHDGRDTLTGLRPARALRE